MKIDLHSYASEFRYWIDAFRPFVERTSQPALPRIARELENGRDNLRPKFDWKLPKPIWTRPSNRYDGRDKTPHTVRIGWQFEAGFAATPESRKQAIWTVSKMVTQMRVCSDEDGAEILHFHHDLKEEGQLGPQVHLQFSEHYLKDKGRIPIAVPRFPCSTMLPTDCFDLVLAEFFPFEWPRSQSGAQGLTTLQKAQRDRLLRMSEALVQAWKQAPRLTPVAATQDCTLTGVQIA